MVEKIKENKYAYVIALACCMVVFGGAGLVFSCASVFYAVVADAFEVGKGTFSIYMSIVCFVMSFSLPIMGKLAAKMDIRKFVAICGACIVLSFVMFAMAPNMIVIYIGAAFQGFGVAGPMYVIVPTMINRWFQKRPAFSSALRWLSRAARLSSLCRSSPWSSNRQDGARDIGWRLDWL